MARKKKPKKPPLDKEAVLTRLQRAREQQRFVSIRRWIPHSDRIDGFVMDVGRGWVLLAELDGVRHDGWCLLRLKDVQAVFIDADPNCLAVAVLKARDQWPLHAPQVELEDAMSAVTSAAAAAPLTTIHVEFDRPDICWIGSAGVADESTLELLEVDTQGQWRRKPRLIDLEDITRIQFGADYEEGLAIVAGPPPAQ